MRIAIAGPPGSGKTTVAALVAESMGYEMVYVGQIFRQMARERKVDLETFDTMAEEDETIDKELDTRMIALARAKEKVVLEGRLTGALLKAHGIPVFSVYIDAPEEVRARRIASRESKDLEAVLTEMRSRERSEKKRYLAYYGIDTSDRKVHDMWIDSRDLPPESIAKIIVAEARKRDAENAGQDEERT